MQNRELKFRIYSYIDKSFHYFDIYDYPDGIAGGVSEPQQYIGLNDKNNKEIYEGDIVRVTFKRLGMQICEIKWGIMGFSFYLVHEKNIHHMPVSINDFPITCEIIGNIIENKI